MYIIVNTLIRANDSIYHNEYKLVITIVITSEQTCKLCYQMLSV